MKAIHLRFGGIFFFIALVLTGLTSFVNDIGTEAMINRSLTSALVFCLVGVAFSVILTRAGFFIKPGDEIYPDYAVPNRFDQDNIPSNHIPSDNQSFKAMDPFSPEAIDPEVSNILNRLPKGGAENSIQNAVDAMRMMGLDDE